MEKLRKTPPLKFLDQDVVALEDYEKRVHIDLTSRKERALTLPQSNILIFFLKNGSKLIARPSGTEPKIKLYVEIVLPSKSVSVEEADKRLIELVDAFKQELL